MLDGELRVGFFFGVFFLKFLYVFIWFWIIYVILGTEVCVFLEGWSLE